MGSIPGLERSLGRGNGNPLQYSCLENSMDREAWRATVHGVAKSQTWLNDWSCTYARELLKELEDSVVSTTVGLGVNLKKHRRRSCYLCVYKGKAFLGEMTSEAEAEKGLTLQELSLLWIPIALKPDPSMEIWLDCLAHLLLFTCKSDYILSHTKPGWRSCPHTLHGQITSLIPNRGSIHIC